MKLYRYELFCDEETQDVGFLVGVKDLGLSSEAEDSLVEPFDSMLKIPDTPEMRNSVSFFTEDGNNVFNAAIQNVISAYEDSIFDVMVTTLILEEDQYERIVYQDEYQVCLPKTLYLGLNTSVKRTPATGEQCAYKTVNPVRIGRLYHVGTMDIAQKSQFSHEGNGLSVSNCPNAWIRITGGHTHGDFYLLTKPDMKLLDYYALTEEERNTISNWAITHGYVTSGKLYKTNHFGEDGETYYSLHGDFADAMSEADDDEELIQEIDGLLPTQKLIDCTFVKVELLAVFSLITCLYAEEVLDYDGVYWDEVLDISSYSAPRGMIFNSKLSSFEIANTGRADTGVPHEPGGGGDSNASSLPFGL